MKSFLKLLFILILMGFPLAKLFAQQEILSAACDATGIGGSVTWSVGQVAYSDWSDVTGTLTEGVQQPYEIFIIYGLEDFEPDPEFIVFPNPTSGKVTLKFFNHQPDNMSSCIYDGDGALLYRIAIDTKEVSIPMDNLKPATYFLIILEKDQPVKSYKIIKR